MIFSKLNHDAGFFFDLDNDGNPGNNFGDYCTGAVNWQFCWTISVLSGPACINGLGLDVSVNTFGDSETGSWGSSACTGDAIILSSPAVIQNCAANAGTGGPLALCSTSLPTALFGLLGNNPDMGGTWTDPSGTPHTGNFDPVSDASGNYMIDNARLVQEFGLQYRPYRERVLQIINDIRRDNGKPPTG